MGSRAAEYKTAIGPAAVAAPRRFCNDAHGVAGAELQQEAFDYIVVGAGAAGCIVASRLAEDPEVSVLLLEAGEKPGIWSRIPLTFRYAIYRSGLVWPLTSEPEPQLNGRRVPLLAGRALGGSSAINGMLYVRGQNAVFDEWEAAGCAGWGAASVAPYFERVEREWPLLSVRDPRLLQTDFARALNVAGIPADADPLSGSTDGYFLPLITVDKRGRRVCSARQHLVRERRNLRVQMGAQATNLHFEGQRARGVRFLQRGRESTAYAQREVILAAGAYQSPKLLLQSGVGPAAELQALNIPVRCALDGVGRNLANHSMVTMRFLASRPLPAMEALRLDRAVLSALTWASIGGGWFGIQPTSQMVMLRTRPWLPQPDCQVSLGTLGIDADWWFPGVRAAVPHAFVAGITQLRPHSRGWLKLASANPLDMPRVQGNVFGDARDLATVIAAMRRVRELFATEPLAQWTEREWRPGAAHQSDDQLAETLAQTAMASSHPVGTCRMGIGADAVVDPDLRVHGIDGLRVADASILPELPGAGTYATTLMVGELAADRIRGSRS